MARSSNAGESVVGGLLALYLLAEAARWVWSLISPVVEPTWPVDLALIGVLVCRRLLRGREAKPAKVAYEMLLPAALGLGARLVLWALLSLILSGIDTDLFAAGESAVGWMSHALGSVLGFRILGLPLFTFLIAVAICAALFFARIKPVTGVLIVKRYSGLAKATLAVMLLFAPVPYASIDGQIAAEAAKRYRLALEKAAPAEQKAVVFDQLKTGLSNLDPQQRSHLLAPAIKVLEGPEYRPDSDTIAQWDLVPEEPAVRSVPAPETLADETPSTTWSDVAEAESEVPRAWQAAAEAEKGFRAELIGALSLEFENTFHKAPADGDLQNLAEALVTDLLAKHAESIYDAYLKPHVRKGALAAAEFTTRILERFGSAHRAWMEARATPPEPPASSSVDTLSSRPEDFLGRRDLPAVISENPFENLRELSRRRDAVLGRDSDFPGLNPDVRRENEYLRERARPVEARPRFVP